MAKIIFLAGPLNGSELDLIPDHITIGRRPEADLSLPDDAVSGSHAEFRFEKDRWHLFDLQSSNGTFVNGNKIRSHLLADSDVVQIGETQFEFQGNGVVADADAHALEDQQEPPILDVPDPHPKPKAKPKPKPASEMPVANREDVELVTKMKERAELIRHEMSKVIIGQREVVDQVLMCIIANGHVLLIGLPGMAKTLMVSTLATVLNLKFKRVQFTPDLMPTDIIGTDVLETNQSTGEKEFRFLQGPIFCNMLLADEINRTPPKTQAALLEAMQEKRVTAGNTTFTLDKPFFVLATQNPIEQEGTYPLPEAQLDRFMFNIWVDYPELEEEERIVGATTGGTAGNPEAVLTREEILQLQDVVRKIPVSEHVIKYAIRMVRATRPTNPDAPEITKTFISTGAGPRAGQYLILAAKSMAVLEGRIHVSCKDIRRACLPVLRHRILTNFAADSEGKTPVVLIEELLKVVEEPSDKDYEGK